jgi:hypothetical protein
VVAHQHRSGVEVHLLEDVAQPRDLRDAGPAVRVLGARLLVEDQDIVEAEHALRVRVEKVHLLLQLERRDPVVVALEQRDMLAAALEQVLR